MLYIYYHTRSIFFFFFFFLEWMAEDKGGMDAGRAECSLTKYQTRQGRTSVELNLPRGAR